MSEQDRMKRPFAEGGPRLQSISCSMGPPPPKANIEAMELKGCGVGGKAEEKETKNEEKEGENEKEEESDWEVVDGDDIEREYVFLRRGA